MLKEFYKRAFTGSENSQLRAEREELKKRREEMEDSQEQTLNGWNANTHMSPGERAISNLAQSLRADACKD